MWYDREPVRFASDKPSLTKQSFADECDINQIMSRFISTGQISHLNHAEPNYGLAPSLDFREALEIVQNSEESFANLPSEIRQRFGQNPEAFLAFVEDETNLPELARMGLVEVDGDGLPPVHLRGEKPVDGQPEASADASPNTGGAEQAPQEGHS